MASAGEREAVSLAWVINSFCDVALCLLLTINRDCFNSMPSICSNEAVSYERIHWERVSGVLLCGVRERGVLVRIRKRIIHWERGSGMLLCGVKERGVLVRI